MSVSTGSGNAGVTWSDGACPVASPPPHLSPAAYAGWERKGGKKTTKGLDPPTFCPPLASTPAPPTGLRVHGMHAHGRNGVDALAPMQACERGFAAR